jgi:hypothetical protein
MLTDYPPDGEHRHPYLEQGQRRMDAVHRDIETKHKILESQITNIHREIQHICRLNNLSCNNIRHDNIRIDIDNNNIEARGVLPLREAYRGIVKPPIIHTNRLKN